MNSEPGIAIRDVVVEHDGFQALEDVTFAVPSGTLMGVLGPNGAGKSTLFDAIAGVHPITSGQITLSGTGQRRGALAYVPQRDSINWSFPATALDVVMMGLSGHVAWYRGPSKHDREIARSCLERVRLWERRGALMTELSGGQRQRVFIARALAQDARIILLDEAFSGVDVAAPGGHRAGAAVAARRGADRAPSHPRSHEPGRALRPGALHQPPRLRLRPPRGGLHSRGA